MEPSPLLLYTVEWLHIFFRHDTGINVLYTTTVKKCLEQLLRVCTYVVGSVAHSTGSSLVFCPPPPQSMQIRLSFCPQFALSRVGERGEDREWKRLGGESQSFVSRPLYVLYNMRRGDFTTLAQLLLPLIG